MNISDLVKFGALPTENVCDQSLDVNLIQQGVVSPQLAIPFGEVLFNVSAGATASLKLFNDSNDHLKEKKIFEDWQEADNIYNDHALICYDLTGNVKAQGSGTVLKKFEIGLDAEQSIGIKSFRIHQCNESVQDAVANDLKSFNTIFSSQSCTNLKINEALSLEAKGQLGLNASVKISDVYSGTASFVADLLSLNGKIIIKAEAAASLKLNLSVEDDFKILIIKTADNCFRVIVSKIIKRTGDLNANAGITAGIEKTEELDQLVDQFFVAIDESLFEPIIDKINSSGLDDNDIDLANLVLSKLGFDVSVPTISEFTELYQGKRKEVNDKLKKFITTKVSIGVAYDYNRMKTSESLFKAEFTENELVKCHKQLITLKIGELVDNWIRMKKNQKPFDLKSYLNRETTDMDSSLGISLAFGNFKIASRIQNTFKESKELVIDTDESIKKRKVSMYIRDTSKVKIFGENKDEYHISFNANMPSYVAEENELTADKFDFDFSTSVEMVEKKTNDVELANVVDWAVTWDIIDPDEFNNVYTQLDELRKSYQGMSYHMFLKISESIEDNGKVFNDLFEIFIEEISKIDNLKVASALAAALPYTDYNKEDFDVRKNISGRRRIYTSFWLQYLENKFFDQASMKPKAFSSLVGDILFKHLNSLGLNHLAHFENDTTEQYPKIGKYSVEELLFTNFVGRRFDLFKMGMSNLQEGIAQKQHYSKTFRKSFRLLNDVGFQEYNLRFIGRLLLDIADEIQTKQYINRALTVKYMDVNGKEQVIVFS